ncbi:MAG: helix-turn-helix transcriptional regulator [Clostridia bacterium]|nr:helix-turn-helix transcriptional regulator [Clostridia bacterium]
MAELCHISESGFFKLFKAVTGVTPITYKHNIMIQHAIDMISNTSLSIEEISGLVGFPSSNYFRKVFADMTGTTPKKLRKR